MITMQELQSKGLDSDEIGELVALSHAHDSNNETFCAGCGDNLSLDDAHCCENQEGYFCSECIAKAGDGRIGEEVW